MPCGFPIDTFLKVVVVGMVVAIPAQQEQVLQRMVTASGDRHDMVDLKSIPLAASLTLALCPLVHSPECPDRDAARNLARLPEGTCGRIERPRYFNCLALGRRITGGRLGGRRCPH